ncbi:prepilin-type N-terminal cleavage/methylation domain-containing protein [bacterium]|nr:prepilin-type N-terminal cleavage/methylation domain-containing protein [bacterium]
MKNKKTQRGFSTLEMLIAMTIMTLVLGAAISVAFGSQSLSADSETAAPALRIAQELIEREQALARKDFNLVNPSTGTNTIGSVTYQEKIDVELQPDYLTKKVTATVSWPGSYGRAQSVSLTALVTNFNNALGGDTCDSTLSGDWAHPEVRNAVTDFSQIVGDPSGLYPITDIDAYKGKLYVTVNSPSIALGPLPAGSGVDDASVGTLAWTGPGNITTDNGVHATETLAGTAATHYLKASNFGFSIPAGATILGIKAEIKRSRSGGSTGSVLDSQVRIVKSSGSFGSVNKAATGTPWPSGSTYAAYGNESDLWGENWSPADINSPNFGVVLSATGSTPATNRTARVDHIRITVTYIKQFYILNITNPAAPALIAGLPNNSGIATGFRAVAVDGHYAYLATHAGPATGQLQILDISGTIPSLVATYQVPGVSGVGGQGLGASIFYSDGYVYLGLTKTASGPEFNIIDVRNPLSPTLAGSYPIGNGINAIHVANTYAYLATPNTQELTTLDVENPASPAAVGGYNAPDAVGNGKSFALVGNTTYLGRTVTMWNPEFNVLDATNPAAPAYPPLGTKEIGSSVNDTIVRDSLAFLITTNGQFQTWNIANPAVITQYAPPLILPNAGFGIAMDCEGNTMIAAAVPTSGAFTDKGSLSFITSGP